MGNNTLTQFSAKFITNDFQGLLNKKGLTIETCNIPPKHIALLCMAIKSGEITRHQGRIFLNFMLDYKKECK